jgi:hypothetical protein
MISRVLAAVVFVWLVPTAAMACPDDQYEEPVTHACLPKSNLPNVPNDINKGVQDLLQGKAPGPAILGTLPGGRRVCIPWC